MDFFKIITLLMLCSITIFSFSKKPKTIKKEDFALVKQYDFECNTEIESKIKEILDIDELKLSKGIFINSQYLDIKNNLGVYKRFLLHDCNKECCISYVTDKNSIIIFKKLKKCNCVKGDF